MSQSPEQPISESERRRLEEKRLLAAAQQVMDVEIEMERRTGIIKPRVPIPTGDRAREMIARAEVELGMGNLSRKTTVTTEDARNTSRPKRPGIVARIGERNAKYHEAVHAKALGAHKAKLADAVVKKAEAAAKREAKRAVPKEPSVNEWMKKKKIDDEKRTADVLREREAAVAKIHERMDAEEARIKAVEDAPTRIIPVAPDVIDLTKPVDAELVGKLREGFVTPDLTKKTRRLGKRLNAEQGANLKQYLQEHFPHARLGRAKDSDWIEEPARASDAPPAGGASTDVPVERELSEDMRALVEKSVWEAERALENPDILERQAAREALESRSNAVVTAEYERRHQLKRQAESKEDRIKRRNAEARNEESGGQWRLPPGSPDYMLPESRRDKRTSDDVPINEPADPSAPAQGEQPFRPFPNFDDPKRSGMVREEETPQWIRAFKNWLRPPPVERDPLSAEIDAVLKEKPWKGAVRERAREILTREKRRKDLENAEILGSREKTWSGAAKGTWNDLKKIASEIKVVRDIREERKKAEEKSGKTIKELRKQDIKNWRSRTFGGDKKTTEIQPSSMEKDKEGPWLREIRDIYDHFLKGEPQETQNLQKALQGDYGELVKWMNEDRPDKSERMEAGMESARNFWAKYEGQSRRIAREEPYRLIEWAEKILEKKRSQNPVSWTPK